MSEHCCVRTFLSLTSEIHEIRLGRKQAHRRDGYGRGAERSSEESHVVVLVCRQLSREVLHMYFSCVAALAEKLCQ